MYIKSQPTPLSPKTKKNVILFGKMASLYNNLKGAIKISCSITRPTGAKPVSGPNYKIPYIKFGPETGLVPVTRPIHFLV